MPDVPKVSIGLITYNQVAIAPMAVKSALAQRWDNLEVVVSDDGSKDGTAEALLELAQTDPRLTVLTAAKNQGITANSNKMLAACTGEYYAAIGGDDALHPDRTRRQVEVLEADRSLAACITGCADFVDDPQRPHAFRDPVARFGRTRLTARDLVRNGNRIAPSPAWMYRRSCAPKQYDPRIPRCSDGMFSFETALNGDLALIPDPLTYYRISPNSAVGSGLGWEPLQVFANIEAAHPEFLRDLRPAKAMEYTTLGRKALQAGDRDGARALFGESLRLDPGGRAAAGYVLSLLPPAGLRWVERLAGRTPRSSASG